MTDVVTPEEPAMPQPETLPENTTVIFEERHDDGEGPGQGPVVTSGPPAVDPGVTTSDSGGGGTSTDSGAPTPTSVDLAGFLEAVANRLADAAAKVLAAIAGEWGSRTDKTVTESDDGDVSVTTETGNQLDPHGKPYSHYVIERRDAKDGSGGELTRTDTRPDGRVEESFGGWSRQSDGTVVRSTVTRQFLDDGSTSIQTVSTTTGLDGQEHGTRNDLIVDAGGKVLKDTTTEF